MKNHYFRYYTKATTMLLKRIIASFFILFIIFQLHAQDKKCPVKKFGAVSDKDFDISKLNIDTTNGAVIIADKGLTIFQGSEKGAFELIFKRETCIKIINKNGFGLANVEVPLYINNQDKEKLLNVHATTYNLEDGKVIATKFDDNAIFEDKKDKNHIVEKFTLPDVKEGSIIEYSYTVSSDFIFNLQPWVFQQEYPTAWSEYEVDVPDFFEYVNLTQGYQPFYSKTESTTAIPYNSVVSENGSYGSDNLLSITEDTKYQKWIMTDVPALKEEPYTTSIQNHIAKIEFQLKGIQYPHEPYEEVMHTWPKVADELLHEDDFGSSLSKTNGWLDVDMSTIVSGAKSCIDSARKIYYYVKNNFKSTGIHGVLEDKSMKEVFKDKSGSSQEINMLLAVMLRHENLNADPVILSTRANGYTQPLYPLLDQYNYVITKLDIDSVDYFLDASRSYLGFGRLPEYCYNGIGAEIATAPTMISFSPDSLQESKMRILTLFCDTTKPGSWNGTCSSYLNYSESSDLRSELLNNGMDEYKKQLKSSFAEGIDISNITVKDVADCEQPLQVNYGLSIQGDNSNIIYFNPIIKDPYSKNPFESAERNYPVEMPYPINETYIINIEVPRGYDVDELPKSTAVSFNETEGLFKYIISRNGDVISLKSTIKFNQADFSPDDYANLREFFDYIVKAHNQQIVFKKKE
jgi:hypothetical protein